MSKKDLVKKILFTLPLYAVGCCIGYGLVALITWLCNHVGSQFALYAILIGGIWVIHIGIMVLSYIVQKKGGFQFAAKDDEDCSEAES